MLRDKIKKYNSLSRRSKLVLRRSQPGFTIVELLVVIVVIAILAAISTVAYMGIQRQAAEVAIKSDLTQAGKQLALEQVEQGNYPGTDGSTTNGSPVLSPSPRTTFQYTRTGENYCLTAISSTDGVPAFHISNTNTTPTEGTCPGHTGPSTGGNGSGNTIANNAAIQSVTSAQCAALPVFTGSNNDAVRTVTDTRGGTTRTYRIAKLADNKCWMLDNLRLGSTSSTITLTPSDSNVEGSFTLPAVTGGSNEYNTPRAYGPVPGDSGSGATNYGYLYNFAAATAGETTTSLPGGNGNASHSICPSGWRLPTGRGASSGGEFAQLDIAFGGTGNYASNGPSLNSWKQATNGPFQGVYSGSRYGSSFFRQGSEGNWWTSSAHPGGAYYAYMATLNSVEVRPGEHYSAVRTHGYAVRCVLN